MKKTEQQKGNLELEQVTDRQWLNKDRGRNKGKGTAGKVGVKLTSKCFWTDECGTKILKLCV